MTKKQMYRYIKKQDNDAQRHYKQKIGRDGSAALERLGQI